MYITYIPSPIIIAENTADIIVIILFALLYPSLYAIIFLSKIPPSKGTDGIDIHTKQHSIAYIKKL